MSTKGVVKVKNDRELFESLSKNAKVELEQEQISFTFKTFFDSKSSKVDLTEANMVLYINSANRLKLIGKENNAKTFLNINIVKSSPGVDEFTWSRLDSVIRMKYIDRIKDYNEDKLKAESAKLNNWLLEIFNLKQMSPKDEVIFKVITGGNLNHLMCFKTTFAHAFAIANYQHKRAEQLGITNFDTKAQLDRMIVIGERNKVLPSTAPLTLINQYFKNAMPKVKAAERDQSSKYEELQAAIGNGEL
uniref:Nucleoprotein n=1 Tax=Peanut yellow spot virus TaxID=63443 RepID=O55844_9VIRU|nr:nucleocapsid protein [Peanut yellow spot virus]